jgi:very-short-patch-repair endonuclease
MEKNKIAINGGFEIIRFWEHDILNNKSVIIEKLSKI